MVHRCVSECEWSMFLFVFVCGLAMTGNLSDVYSDFAPVQLGESPADPASLSAGGGEYRKRMHG